MITDDLARDMLLINRKESKQHFNRYSSILQTGKWGSKGKSFYNYDHSKTENIITLAVFSYL